MEPQCDKDRPTQVPQPTSADGVESTRTSRAATGDGSLEVTATAVYNAPEPPVRAFALQGEPAEVAPTARNVGEAASSSKAQAPGDAKGASPPPSADDFWHALDVVASVFSKLRAEGRSPHSTAANAVGGHGQRQVTPASVHQALSDLIGAPVTPSEPRKGSAGTTGYSTERSSPRPAASSHQPPNDASLDGALPTWPAAVDFHAQGSADAPFATSFDRLKSVTHTGGNRPGPSSTGTARLRTRRFTALSGLPSSSDRTASVVAASREFGDLQSHVVASSHPAKRETSREVEDDSPASVNLPGAAEEGRTGSVPWAQINLAQPSRSVRFTSFPEVMGLQDETASFRRPRATGRTAAEASSRMPLSATTGDIATGGGPSMPDIEDPPSSGPADRTAGGASRHKQTGLLEAHPLALSADLLYVLATVTHLGAALTAIELQPDETYPYVLGIAACQLVTLLWTALRFFVQLRVGTWEIIAHLPEIRKQYRQSWLAFDAVCAAPVDFVVLVWSSEVFFWLQLRQVVRVVRFVSMGRSGNPLKERRLHLLMFIFACVVLLMLHVAAVSFQAVEAEHRSLSYVDALYWTATTVSSVGYGDVVPAETAGSRVYAAGIMFAGVAIVSTVTAVATSMLTSRDALEESVREKKQMLASMLEYYSVPWEEQIEIIGLFPTALDAENEKNFTSLVSNMPGFIVERIEGYTRAKALSSSIPLFSELPITVTLEVTSKLHQRFSPANEPIIEFGAEGNEMFFLVRGVADVVVPVSDSEDLVVAVLRSGAFFGEMALVQDTKRAASVIAVVLCELLVLSKADFLHLVTNHSVLNDLFLSVVFARHKVTQLARENSTPSASVRSEQNSVPFSADGEGTTQGPSSGSNPLAGASVLGGKGGMPPASLDLDGSRDALAGNSSSEMMPREQRVAARPLAPH